MEIAAETLRGARRSLAWLGLLRRLGIGWAWFRVGYWLRRRLGHFERHAPITAWTEVPAYPTAAWLSAWPVPARLGAGCVPEAEQVLAGQFLLFSRHRLPLGSPPDWHRNALTGERLPVAVHWSRIATFSGDDIKGVWEMSRLSWAFALARAYVRTGDSVYHAGLWRLVTDWQACNPPNAGPNWMCGQETALRLVAATFAFAVTSRDPGPTEQATSFAKLVHASALRIEANLEYGLSQANNHGISECLGLVTAALAIPSAPEAPRWLARGLRELRRQLAALIYPDGAFAQHSLNYHRLLLDNLLWLTCVLRLSGHGVPRWLSDGGLHALAFLDRLVAADTGRGPLYGANDGARLLQLADAEYTDFRPTIQAGYAVWQGRRRYPEGPWDEAAEWLAGPEWKGLPMAPSPMHSWHARDGGCLLLANAGMRLFFRCPERFRHRPSQADLLHVEIEWNGNAILVDAGTYSYNAPGPLVEGLSEAASHNTVTFNGQEPISKVSKFLYSGWPKGVAGWQKSGVCFFARHDGWRAIGVRHERSVVTVGAGFGIQDSIAAREQCLARWHWLLADGPVELDSARGRLLMDRFGQRFEITWTPRAGQRVNLRRAEADTATGWRSQFYGEAEPAIALTIEEEVAGNCHMTTIFAPVANG